MARARRRSGVELQQRVARLDALVTPACDLRQRPGAHARSLDHGIDAVSRDRRLPLPAAERPVAMPQRQHRRHQQLAHHLQGRWRRDLDRVVAGDEVGQQPDRIELGSRTARQHAAILAHHVAERLDETRLAMKPPGLAVGQQQAGSDHARPACNLRKARTFTRCALVEPAGGLGDGGEHLRLQGLVVAGQHQRGVDQPCHQPEAGVFDFPCGALARLAVGVEPHGGDALGHRRSIGARRGGGQIGQPREGMQHPLDRRRGPRRTGEIEPGDRQAHAVDEEMTGAQSRARRAVAAIGAFDRRQHPQRLRTTERGGNRMAGDAEAIGPADQRLARTARCGDHIAQRQRPAGFLGRRRGGRDLRLGPCGQHQRRAITHPLHQRIGAAAGRGAQQRRHQPCPFNAAILAA